MLAAICSFLIVVDAVIGCLLSLWWWLASVIVDSLMAILEMSYTFTGDPDEAYPEEGLMANCQWQLIDLFGNS